MLLGPNDYQPAMSDNAHHQSPLDPPEQSLFAARDDQPPQVPRCSTTTAPLERPSHQRSVTNSCDLPIQLGIEADSGDGTAHLTTMAAYLTSLPEAPQVAKRGAREHTGQKPVSRTDGHDPCPRYQSDERQRIERQRIERHSRPACRWESEVNLEPLRALANETVEMAFASSGRRRRAVRRLAFLFGGLVVLYVAYHLVAVQQLDWRVFWSPGWSPKYWAG